MTLLEMAFAGHCGLEIDLADVPGDPLAKLFSEEAGVVVQVPREHLAQLQARAQALDLGSCLHVLGSAVTGDAIVIRNGEQQLLNEQRPRLQQLWSRTSFELQSLRDNPDCAREEYEAIGSDDPGLSAQLSYDPQDDISAPFIATGVRPPIAILREQGVNGQVEMAAAFHRAGFNATDVHMSDLHSSRRSLSEFKALVGLWRLFLWRRIGRRRGLGQEHLFNSRLRDEFAAFFERDDCSLWAYATAARWCLPSRT